MTMRPAHFMLILTLVLATAAVAFYGRFRSAGDQFDELEDAFSRMRNRLQPGRLISVYSLRQEGEVPGYAANILAPVPVLAHSLLTDTVIFIRDSEHPDSVWQRHAATRVLLDSERTAHFQLVLTARRK